MRVVVALGGNALLRRGEPLTAENQRENVARACAALAPLALEHELMVSHGNGPQVGLLALQSAAYGKVETYPLDVLDAQTQGMIGYLIMQELGNLLPPEKPVATLLTMIEVDPKDPAFADPTKPIGPVYSREEAAELAAERGWSVKPDGASMRHVVPSPLPTPRLRARAGALASQARQRRDLRRRRRHSDDVCHRGTCLAGRRLIGVEAVIDKDLASARLALELKCGRAAGSSPTSTRSTSNWGTWDQLAIRTVTAANLDAGAEFAEGSMGPKVRAAREFVEREWRFRGDRIGR